MRDNEKEDARKRGGGADKRVGAHSRYQFFRCGKIGGGADKRWGALWRYSTVVTFLIIVPYNYMATFPLRYGLLPTWSVNDSTNYFCEWVERSL